MPPGSAKIGPEVEADDLDMPRLKICIQVAMKCLCLWSRDLVLDRDVRPPGLHVLWAEPGHEFAFQSGTNAIEFLANYREGDAGAEMPYTTDLGYDRIHISGRALKLVDNSLLIFAGKPMKHRQVCA